VDFEKTIILRNGDIYLGAVESFPIIRWRHGSV